MKFSILQKILSLIFVSIFLACTAVNGQNRDNLPSEFREYTNPEEVVTFDRTTSFARALDVINQFAQNSVRRLLSIEPILRAISEFLCRPCTGWMP